MSGPYSHSAGSSLHALAHLGGVERQLEEGPSCTSCSLWALRGGEGAAEVSGLSLGAGASQGSGKMNSGGGPWGQHTVRGQAC